MPNNIANHADHNSAFSQVRLLIIMVVIMISIHVVNILSGGALKQFGVIPRELSSLLFIFPSAWIHGDISHLVNNLPLLVILSWLCMVHRSIRYYITASLFIILAGGLILWVIGRHASHIGASGWIFGLWGLLIANAYFEKSFKSLIISIIVIVLYNGLIFGLFPAEKGVSYESHISGLVAGVLFAWLYNKLKKDDIDKRYSK